MEGITTDTNITTSTTPAPSKRSAPRLPQAAVQILETWLLEHRDTPYVTTQEQDQLKARTGLRRSQIKTWFANARKRRRIESLMRPSLLPPPFHADDHYSAASLSATDQEMSSRSPLPYSHFTADIFPNLTALDPFERWLMLGPEHEPATVKAIQEAIEVKDSAPGDVDAAQYKHFKPTRSKCSWPSSLEIRSYAANKYSVTSDQWKPGSTSRSVDYQQQRPPSKPARRHRRSEPSLAGSGASRGTGHHVDGAGKPAAGRQQQQKRFQCTFCSDAFVKRHDWQRHEKSQHLALEWWTCCPDGVATYIDPLTTDVTCVFCGLKDPDRDHLDSQHALAQCVARSEAERTFYRKDHLRQHLRLMHAECPFTPAMESWKTELVELRSRCGFCGVVFETWSARVNHLASHFRAGVSMVAWQGDWGLEPAVAANLERATLPADRVVAWAMSSPVEEEEEAEAEDESVFSDLNKPPSAYPLAPPSISDASGVPWDFSFLDFETLPSTSVIDPFDNYSFSAASGFEFFDQFGQMPLETPPPIQEDSDSPLLPAFVGGLDASSISGISTGFQNHGGHVPVDVMDLSDFNITTDSPAIHHFDATIGGMAAPHDTLGTAFVGASGNLMAADWGGFDVSGGSMGLVDEQQQHQAHQQQQLQQQQQHQHQYQYRQRRHHLDRAWLPYNRWG